MKCYPAARQYEVPTYICFKYLFEFKRPPPVGATGLFLGKLDMDIITTLMKVVFIYLNSFLVSFIALLITPNSHCK